MKKNKMKKIYYYKYNFYVHIPAGVRDGRVATLLIQVQLIIALLRKYI